MIDRATRQDLQRHVLLAAGCDALGHLPWAKLWVELEELTSPPQGGSAAEGAAARPAEGKESRGAGEGWVSPSYGETRALALRLALRWVYGRRAELEEIEPYALAAEERLAALGLAGSEADSGLEEDSGSG